MKNAELLNQQTNPENPDKDTTTEQLFKVKPITGTPFHVLNRDGIYYLTMGNNLLSPPTTTEAEIAEYIEKNTWNLITTVFLLLHDKAKKGEL